jgi:hypothetical protein
MVTPPTSTTTLMMMIEDGVAAINVRKRAEIPLSAIMADTFASTPR